MGLAIKVGKDGKYIRPSKEDIQREKSRMDRLRRRREDVKRKRAEEKRLDRKNVRTPPGKPGVGIGRKNLTRKVPGTKAPGSGTRVRRPAPISAAEMRKRQRSAAIKKLREEQAKKRPTVKKKATRVTTNTTRKNPMVKAPGSGTRVKRPLKIGQQPNITAADMKNVKSLPSSKVKRGPRGAVGSAGRPKPLAPQFRKTLVNKLNQRAMKMIRGGRKRGL